MGDKVSSFLIGFDGDAGDIASVLASLKSSVKSTVSELESITRKVDLFGDLEKNTQSAFTALEAAKTKVNDLRDALEKAKKSGAGSTDDLNKALKAAQAELTATNREYLKSVDTLSKLENELTKAKVDTGNLAQEQVRLSEAARQANAALVDQQSKAALSLKTFRDIQPEINRLNAAFISLRDSGKLSFGELSIAEARLQQQIGTLRAEVSGVGAAFSSIRGQLLAVTAAFAGIATGVFDAAKNWRDFAQQVAAIDSIAESSKATIDRLAAGVRQLSIEMGLNAVNSAKALYEIISSGIPAENALTVLALASKAAIAGITDVDTAARVGVAVLNAYGLQISDLAHVYDVLFQTVKDGVITFPELAKNLGAVLPAARAAKVTIEELGAAFVVLTRQGLDAPEAATAINKAILDLSAPAPEAAQRMRDLGIELRGLTETIKQLAERKLTLGQLADIIPDVRAQRAVLALAQNYTLLKDELGLMNKEAAQTQAAYLKLADTPQQQVARFDSAWKDLTLSLGQFVTGTGGTIQSLTALINSFNALSPSTKSATFEITAVVTIGGLLVVLARQLAIPLNLLAGALFSVGSGGAAAATGMTAASLAASGLQVAIAGVLGYKLGEWGRENSAVVRVLGDAIGLSAAAFVNLAEFGIRKATAELTGNTAASAAATAAYIRNAEEIRTSFANAISGATERLRALGEQQKVLVGQLATTSAAAVEASTNLGSFVSRIQANVDADLRGVEQIVSRLQARLLSLTEQLKDAVAQTQALTTSALANLSAQTAAKIGELESMRTKEVEIIKATTQIYADDSAKRLALLKQLRIDAVTAFEAEAASRIEIAKRTGEDLKKVEQQVNTERRALLQSFVDATRAAANESLGQWQQHLANIRSLDEQRVGITESVEQKIRELKRETFTVQRQYSDKVLEIESTISKARQALIDGDTKAAERYAQEAISLVGGVGKAVVDGNVVVVSTYSAQQTAIRLLTGARDIELEVISKKKKAEEEGAEASRKAYDANTKQLADLTKQLDEVAGKVREGLALVITAKTDAVIKTIAELDVEIAKQTHLLDVKADITKAQVEIKRLKDELEAGVTVNVKGRTDEIEAAIKRIQDSRPDLKLDTTQALAALNTLRQKADDLANVQLRISSNAAEVQKEIDKLKQPTSSEHTVYITKVERNASGGFVGGLSRGGNVGVQRGGAQRFAGGGPVFRKPDYSKVPGYGSGDTVPALLKSGSFVMRKAASARFGDGAMGKLARGFAEGGYVADGLEGLAVTPANVQDGLGELMGALQYFFDRSGVDFRVNKSGGGGSSKASLLAGFGELMAALQFYIGARGIADPAVQGGIPRSAFDGEHVTTGVLWDGLGEMMVALQSIIRAEGLGGFVGSFQGVGVNSLGLLDGADGFDDTVRLESVLNAMVDMQSALQFLIHGKGYKAGGGVGMAFGGLIGGLLSQGRASNLGSGSKNYQYPDPRWVDNWQEDPPENAPDSEILREVRAEADQFFSHLLEWGYGLPSSPYGDLSDYIRRAHDRLNATNDITVAVAILDNMKAQADTFITTFRASRAFHVPAVQPVTAIGLDSLDRSDKAVGERSKAEQDRLAARKKRYGFAGGGGVGDTVPAWLTPGEWVIEPAAVQAIARRFGGGFLPALNAMTMDIPQGFSVGGPVLGPGMPLALASGGAVGSPGDAFAAIAGATGDTHYHISTNEPLSEDYLRRTVVPFLDKVNQRNRR